jgi:hypothetical protein
MSNCWAAGAAKGAAETFDALAADMRALVPRPG